MKVNMYEHKKLAGWWTLDYRPEGAKGPRHRDHFKTRHEAEEAKAELEGGHRGPVFPKLKEVAEEYLQWCEGNLSEPTCYNKRNRLRRHIIPALGEYRVRDLSQRILDGYAKCHSKTVVLVDLRHLKAMIAWMVKRHYAEPLTWVPEMPTYKRQVKRLPDAEQINRLISSLRSERHRIACFMMLLTGLRWNEVANLRWENYRDGAILLAVTKTDQTEVVAVPGPCLEWFEAHKKANGWVFAVEGKNTRPGDIRKPLTQVSKATGIKMSPHMFRHASATALYDLTGDIYAVQHHLRHSSLSATQIYTRYSEVKRRGAIEALTDAFKVDKKEEA